jgi:hypothetical protein
MGRGWDLSRRSLLRSWLVSLLGKTSAGGYASVEQCDGAGGDQHAGNAREFARWILEWSRTPERLAEMRLAARESAERFSWDAVWEDVYRRYEVCFPFTAGHSLPGDPHELPNNIPHLVPG